MEYGTREGGRFDQDVRGKSPTDCIDGHHHVFEFESTSGDGMPGLVDRLLGAEEEPIPTGSDAAGECFYRRSLDRQGNRIEYSVRQGVIHLGIDAEAPYVCAPGHRSCPVPGAVRDASDHAHRPSGRAAPQRQDGTGWKAESGQRIPSAEPPCRELSAALVHGSGDGGLLFRKQSCVRGVVIYERAAHGSRQDLGYQFCSSLPARTGLLGALSASVVRTAVALAL